MTSRRDLPDTMTSPMSGKPLSRAVRPVVVEYGGERETVDLPGYYAADDDEDAVHVGDDMLAADADGSRPAQTFIGCDDEVRVLADLHRLPTQRDHPSMRHHRGGVRTMNRS